MGYSKWRDPAIRAFWTFWQGFLSVLLLLAVPILSSFTETVAGGGEATIDLGFWSSVGIAAVAGGLAGLISFLKNLVDELLGYPIGPK